MKVRNFISVFPDDTRVDVFNADTAYTIYDDFTVAELFKTPAKDYNIVGVIISKNTSKLIIYV